jgi:hypothetical protein
MGRCSSPNVANHYRSKLVINCSMADAQHSGSNPLISTKLMSFHLPIYLWEMEGIKTGSKEYRKEQYEKNKERYKANNKKWFANNVELIKTRQKERYKNTPDEIKAEWALSKRQRRLKLRAFIEEYKDSCVCGKCGDERNYVLDFHHIDPNEKDFNLGDATKHSLKDIKNELEKCITLCRNCHSEFHYFKKEKGIKIKEYLSNTRVMELVYIAVLETVSKDVSVRV